MNIPPEHLEISTPNKAKPGGQYCGVGLPTVKIAYLPDHLEVVCGTERSQFANKELAVAMIKFALKSKERKNKHLNNL